jgi:hypothetical protein
MTTGTTLPQEHRNRFAGICAPRAEIFVEGVPFVRGWAQARSAGMELAKHLENAGLTEVFPGLRADVSVNGDGLVCLGIVDVETAQRLEALLLRGLCVEMDRSLGASESPSTV